MVKFSLNKIYKKEIFFWITAVILFLILVFYAISTLGGLFNKAGKLAGGSLIKPAEIVRFNLTKVQQIKKR